MEMMMENGSGSRRPEGALFASVREQCRFLHKTCNSVVESVKSKDFGTEQQRKKLMALTRTCNTAAAGISNDVSSLHSLSDTPIDVAAATELRVTINNLTRNLMLVICGQRSADDESTFNEISAEAVRFKESLRAVLLSVQSWQAREEDNERLRRLKGADKEATQLGREISHKLKKLLATSDLSLIRGQGKEIQQDLEALISLGNDADLQKEGEILRESCEKLVACIYLRSTGEFTEQDIRQGVRELVGPVKELVSGIVAQSKKAQQTPDSESESLFSSKSLNGMPIPEKKVAVRTKVVTELFETESTYLTQLQVLLNKCILPMCDPNGNWHKLLDCPELQNTADSLAKIIELTEKLRGDLLTALAALDPDIGEIFLQVAPMFTAYQGFINNYSAIEDAVEKARKKKKSFDNFIKEFCKNEQGGDIGMYFILPIQRPPRYQLLLKELCKHTVDEELGLKNIKGALVKIEEVNTLINIRKKEDENKKRIQEIEDTIKSEEPLSLYVPGRWFLREATMANVVSNRVGSGTHIGSKYKYFLFNDIMIKTKPLGSKKFKYILTISFSDYSLVTDQPKGVEHYFALVQDARIQQDVDGKKKKKKFKPITHKFMCFSEAEKQSWIKDIDEAISVNKLMKII